MLPEDAIKLEDDDPRAGGPLNPQPREVDSVLVELEELALHAVEIVEARQLAQVARLPP